MHPFPCTENRKPLPFAGQFQAGPKIIIKKEVTLLLRTRLMSHQAHRMGEVRVCSKLGLKFIDTKTFNEGLVLGSADQGLKKICCAVM